MIRSIPLHTPDIIPHVPQARRGLAQVLVAAVLFALNAVVAKVALDAGVAPARLTALRCTGAAAALGLVLAVTDRSRLRVQLRDLPSLAMLGFLGAALIQWLYFVAIDRLPVGIGLLLEFTGPLLVAVFSRVVLREVVDRRIWLALGIALLGLAMVAQVWRDVGLDPIGVAAGLGAASCLAAYFLLSKHTLARRDPISLTFWMFAFAAIFWAVAQPWWRFDAGMLTRRVSMLGAFESTRLPLWAPIVWVILVGTLAPYALNIASLRHLPATTVGVVGMIEPVIAAAAAWVWLGQVLGAVQLVGGVVLLAGVVLAQTARPAAPTDSEGVLPVLEVMALEGAGRG
jgi:drug/metabolite transporter (DMT)-like permease